MFISYAKEDQSTVDHLKPVLRRLQIELGVEFFQDAESIVPGAQWENAISDALEQSGVFVCLLSTHYFSSSFIQRDELPFINRQCNVGINVIPIYIEPVYISPTSIFSKIQGINNPDRPINQLSEGEFASFILDFEKHVRNIAIANPLPYSRPMVRYNLVVVGKTGAGKSELVNYLFGQNVARSGIGRPITPIGFHRHDFVIAGVPASVWDSAGLEIGNANEWKQILEEELATRGPTEPIQKWFHTVLYCVQATGARFEDFELNIVKEFISKRYNVIIVITKCFISTKKIDELKRSVLERLPNGICCLCVNSTDEEIREMVIPSYGRYNLFKEIQASLIESLTSRIPARCIGFMGMEIDKNCMKIIEDVKMKSGLTAREYIREFVIKELTDISSSITSPQGKFAQIIKEETRITLKVYREISGIIDQAIVVIEENGVVMESSSASISKMKGFWSVFEKAFDELYDWDMTAKLNTVFHPKFSEVVDLIAKGLFSPIAFILGFSSAGSEYITDHLAYTGTVCDEIKKYNKKIKEDLWKNESSIRKLFSDIARDVL